MQPRINLFPPCQGETSSGVATQEWPADPAMRTTTKTYFFNRMDSLSIFGLSSNARYFPHLLSSEELVALSTTVRPNGVAMMFFNTSTVSGASRNRMARETTACWRASESSSRRTKSKRSARVLSSRKRSARDAIARLRALVSS